MNIEPKHINAVLFPLAIGLACYGTYNTVKDAKKYKSVDDLKTEIAQKAPNLYDSLKNDNVARLSYKDWEYEVNRMNDSIKADSLAQRAYFEGVQMVRDSIKNTEGALK